MKENAIKKEMKMKQCPDLPLRKETRTRKEAHKFLETAMDSSATSAERHFYLGKACYTLKCCEEAFAAFKEALSLDPNHALAFEAMMEACDSMALYDEGVIETCTKIISCNPKHAAAHALLGACYYTDGLEDEAISVSKEAIAIDPELQLPHFTLGAIYAQSGDRRSAMKEYKTLRRSDKNLADDLLNFIHDITEVE
jgi:tetratricopeptide (TPR) repeat protein